MRPSGRHCWLPSGQSAEAVTEVSAFAQKPMRDRDVRAPVEVVLGAPIPASTVNEVLSTHTRKQTCAFAEWHSCAKA